MRDYSLIKEFTNIKVNRSKKIFLTCAIITYIGLSILYLIAGHLHNAESGYVHVSQLVYQGKIPYLDFAYNQTPLYPYILGLPLHFLGHNIYTGRACSLIFSLLTFFLSLRLAKKLGGDTAVMVTAGLLAFNAFQVYSLIITKMYALTALVIMIAVYVLFLPMKKTIAYSLAVAILTIGIGFRLTLLPALFIILAGIMILERRSLANVIPPILTFIMLSFIIFTPFAINGWEQFHYNIIGHNLDIYSGIKAKLHASNDLFRNYFFSFLMIAFIGVYRLMKLPSWSSFKERTIQCLSGDEAGPKSGYIPLLWTVAALMTASHVMAKLPQASYQSTVFPLIALLIGVAFSTMNKDMELMKRNGVITSGLKAAFIAGCILTLLSHGLSSLAPAGNRHSPMFIKDQADYIKAHTGLEDRILSSDTQLIAVEAQRELLRGFAWNEYYPEWSVERAKKMSVVNNEILHDYLSKKEAKAVIFSDASFTLSFPSFRPLTPEKREEVIHMVREYYYLAKTFPNIYNSKLKTYIYFPKPDNGE